MTARRTRRLSARVLERLLIGAAAQPDELRTLLDAAAGPGSTRDRAAEAAAVQAFIAASQLTPLPSDTVWPSPMERDSLSRLLAVKTLAVIALIGGLAGGVAIAATGDGGRRDDAPSATTGARPELPEQAADRASHALEAEGSGQLATPSSTERDDEHGLAELPRPQPGPKPGLSGLCRAGQAGAGDNPGRAEENPVFAELADQSDATDGPDNLGRNCADRAADGPPGRPDTGPANPDHSAGPPSDGPAAERPAPTAHAGGPDRAADQHRGGAARGRDSRSSDR
jgi:hypothetical protein